MSDSTQLVHVTFVCSGNICRSPMAEKVFAHQIDQRGLAHLGADLVIALGRNHVRMLTHLGVEPERVRLLRSFDPRSGKHADDVEDPYYGGHADFEETFTVIEAALPGLHAWVDDRLAGEGLTG